MQGKVSRSNAPITRVKCHVNSCNYWDSGDRCLAESIEVQPPNAADSQTTDCATFAHK
ncbi:MAG: DUF1540 domain-containing protein [Desulfitobacteriaceae bacterium]